MKALRVWLLCLLVASSCRALEKSSADLQQKADAASGRECVRFSMQAARQLLEDANRLFRTGEAKAAHKAVDSSLHYAHRSVDCSLQTRKGEKADEIDLRKLIRRMKDVMQTLDSEDRPHLARSLSDLEKEQDKLLYGMFGPAAVSNSPEKKP